MTRIPLLPALALALSMTACVDEADDAHLEDTEQAVLLPGYELIDAETRLDSTSIKQLQVECPEGKQVLGAGYMGLDEKRQFVHAVSTYSAPSWDGRSWLMNARNLSWWGREWTLHVQIACVKERKSYQVVTADSTYGQVVVACPRGKVTTGGGYGLLDATDAIMDGEATYFEPSWDGKSWLINGRGYGSTKLRGFAVCLDSRELPGYEVVTVTGVLDTVNYKQVIAGCPSPKVATGGGWGVLDSTSAIYDGSALLHSRWGSGSEWITNGWNNAAGDWKLQVRMLCVE